MRRLAVRPSDSRIILSGTSRPPPDYASPPGNSSTHPIRFRFWRNRTYQGVPEPWLLSTRPHSVVPHRYARRQNPEENCDSCRTPKNLPGRTNCWLKSVPHFQIRLVALDGFRGDLVKPEVRLRRASPEGVAVWFVPNLPV